MLSRAQFLALTGLTSDAHTALKRRDQIPLPNKGRRYTAFEALAVNIAERLADSPDGHGQNRALATSVVRDVLRQLAQRGSEIWATAENFRREEGSPPIFAGRLNTASGPLPFCGTATELAGQMGAADVLDVMLFNATAALVQLQYRADRSGIDLAKM